MKKKKATAEKTVTVKEKKVIEPKAAAAKEKKAVPSKKEHPVGLTKQYLKSKPLCKVTFVLPKEAAPGAKAITVVGDFNNWDKGSLRMKKQKDGNYAATLELEKGREYRFRYLVDDSRWENDWNADGYLPNPFGGDDSVVSV